MYTYINRGGCLYIYKYLCLYCVTLEKKSSKKRKVSRSKSNSYQSSMQHQRQDESRDLWVSSLRLSAPGDDKLASTLAHNAKGTGKAAVLQRAAIPVTLRYFISLLVASSLHVQREKADAWVKRRKMRKKKRRARNKRKGKEERRKENRQNKFILTILLLNNKNKM
jgi:hypothetical protein